MVLYRDDHQDNLILRDEQQLHFTMQQSDHAYINDSVRLGLALTSTESIYLQDDYQLNQIIPSDEQAQIRDDVLSKHHHRILIDERVTATAIDISQQRISLSHVETIAIDDESSVLSVLALSTDKLGLFDKVNHQQLVRENINERIKIDDSHRRVQVYRLDFSDDLSLHDGVSKSFIAIKVYQGITVDDTWFTQKSHGVHLTESMLVRDTHLNQFSVQVDDVVSIIDDVQGILVANQLSDENALIQEQWQAQQHLQQLVNEHINVMDSLSQQVIAHDDIHEWLWVQAEQPSEWQRGLAWTANTDNWAMSRYEDFPYTDLCVIDGVLYGCNAQGVFRLQDHQQEVHAYLRYGQLDIGQGQLVHPNACYMEYQLQGVNKQLSMEIETTQLGTTNRYRYHLRDERADYLTNGRVQFGRGLRGRYFALDVRLSAHYAYIPHLSLDFTATSRRV